MDPTISNLIKDCKHTIRNANRKLHEVESRSSCEVDKTRQLLMHLQNNEEFVEEVLLFV